MKNPAPTPRDQHDPLPVLCDRCRAQGVAGDENFTAVGDLLDFTPVPRRHERVDGWTAERQRAFVAALAVTGSRRRAAAAVGKAQFGVDQLLAAPGSESFRAACDAAMAMARETGRGRLASGLGQVAGEAAAWAPPPGPWSGAWTRVRASERARAAADDAAPKPPMSDEKIVRFLDELVRRYLIKVKGEREARLAGRVVEADFYVRQLTQIEVMLDLGSEGGFRAFEEFRDRNPDLIDIAETPMSEYLGLARRAKWAELGEPPRPEHPPADRLVDHGAFKTEPLEYTRGGQALSREEQEKAFREQHARDAKKQVEWEARARRDHEERRASDAST